MIPKRLVSEEERVTKLIYNRLWRVGFKVTKSDIIAQIRQISEDFYLDENQIREVVMELKRTHSVTLEASEVVNDNLAAKLFDTEKVVVIDNTEDITGDIWAQTTTPVAAPPHPIAQPTDLTELYDTSETVKEQLPINREKVTDFVVSKVFEAGGVLNTDQIILICDEIIASSMKVEQAGIFVTKCLQQLINHNDQKFTSDFTESMRELNVKHTQAITNNVALTTSAVNQMQVSLVESQQALEQVRQTIVEGFNNIRKIRANTLHNNFNVVCISVISASILFLATTFLIYGTQSTTSLPQGIEKSISKVNNWSKW